MTGKMIGASLIIAACGLFGFSMASGHRKEERALQQLMGALEFMECELKYHLTPLPELCQMASDQCTGCIQMTLLKFAAELENQIFPDVSSCMNAALAGCGELPQRTEQALRLLGSNTGRFDAEGQLRGLEMVCGFCRNELEELSVNRDSRLRSYQTLGLCAGAALVILFV